MNAISKLTPRVEILEPGDFVHVVVLKHPFSTSSSTLEAPSGLSLREIVTLAESRMELDLGPLAIFVDGEVIPKELWHRVRVKSGVEVLLRAVPGFDGGNDLLKSVLSLAVVALALILPVVLIPAGGIFAALLGAAITIGGQLLINALFPVSKPQLGNESRSSTQSYSLGGGSNQADPFGVIPDVMGVHRMYPKLGAQWYTEFIGDDQYLRGLVVWGYGPLQVSQLKIGETPIESFDDVTIETREGYVDDAPITLYPNEVVQTDLSVDLTAAAGWQERTTAAAIDEISVDIVAAGGLVRYDDAGAAQYYTVSLRAEYRLVGTTNWLLIGTMDLTARSRDAIRRGMRKTVPSGQYDVRIQKTSSDAGSDKVSEDVVWTALRGFRNSAPISFSAPLCITAIRIKATSQLNGVVSTLNAVVSSPMKSWSGTEWVDDVVTRNPADHFRKVLQSAANARPQADSRIDLVTLQQWSDYCRAEGFTFDAILDSETSVYDTLVKIAAGGRAAVLFRDGKWSVVWDQPSAPIAQHFTPRNSWGFAGQRVYRNLPHAWRVRFVNEQKGWGQDERIVYDDGYSDANATLFEGIEFPGQTNPDNVWRHGRFHIAQARLRPEIYTLNVDVEQLAVTRGDRVRVQHDVPMFGLQSGRVKSVTLPDAEALVATNTIVVLDEPVTMEALKNYTIRFRLADGTSVTRTVATDDGENVSIELTGSGSSPSAGDLFMFGESGSETVVLRVRGIVPGDEYSARLSLVDDAPQISEADGGVIPTFNSQISVPANLYTASPVNLRIQESLTTTGGTVVNVVRLTWETLAGQYPASFEVETLDDNGDPHWAAAGTSVAPSKFVLIPSLEAGEHSFRVRSVFADGTSSGWATLASQSLDGLGAVPGDVESFTVQVIDDQSTLAWLPATGPVDHYVIRFAPVLTGATWGSATVLQDRVDATSVQVPTLVGTFLIKAVTAAGVESTNATAISSSVAGLRELNVVELWEGQPDWTGDDDNVFVEDDSLRLLAYDGVLDWPPILDITSLFWTTQFPFDYGSLQSDVIIDLGEIFTSRVSARIDAFGDNINNVIGSWGLLGSIGYIGGTNADAWSVRLFESHTNDDPEGVSPDWTPYTELAIRDISARAFRFELRLYSLSPGITPVVVSARVTIDMPDRVVAGNDLISNAGSTLRVDFDPPFRSFEGLGIADQNTGTGDYYVITSKDETGFNIRFYNSAATGVARTFDYVAKGYGKKLDA